MIALIIKELRRYAHQPGFRRVQHIVLCLLAFALFAIAFEQFTLSRGRPQIRVGERIYAIFVPLFFCLLVGLVVPKQAVETFQIEEQSSNRDLFFFTPISHRKFLLGKLVGTLIATMWCLWLAIPLVGVSVYTGGLGGHQLLQCGLVFIVSFTLFVLIGFSLTLFGSSLHAISRSYAIVLLLTFVPLLAPTLTPLRELPAALLDLLWMLSPLCVLITLVKSEGRLLAGVMPIWLGMILCHAGLSALLFWICSRQLAKCVYPSADKD